MKPLQWMGCLLLACSGLNGQAQVAPPNPAAPLKQLTVPKDSLVMKQVNQAAKQQLDSVVGLVKSPLKQLPLQQLQQGVKLFEGGKPVSISKLSADVEYAYFQDTSGVGLGVFRQMTGIFGYNVNYGVAVTGMPFQMGIRENNGINTLNYTPFQNFYQFNFDHQQYLQNLRNKLMEKLSPEALMNSALSRVNTIRKNYEQQLKDEVFRMQQDYAKQYKSTVSVPSNATNLAASDMGAVRTQLMPADSLRKYEKEMDRLQNMIRSKDPQTLSKDTAYLGTLANVKRYETLENIFTKIMSWKKRFEDNPLVKQLRSTSPMNPTALKAYLSDPNNLGQVLNDQASLSAMQKLFFYINKLDVGQNAPQSGELGVQNVVNTGVNTEFQNKSTTMGVMYGQNNSVNNWQQAGLTSQVTSEYTNLTAFKIGTGTGSPVDQSISFDFFHLNNAPSGAGQTGSSYLPVAPHQDGAITLHTGFQFAGSHSVTLDLSRSFGSYSQNSAVDSLGAGGTGLATGKLPPGGSVFNGAGKANYAGILTYTGEIFKTDLKIYAKKVGLGYSDPGNPLLHSGETELKFGLGRKLLKQKLTLKYEGDYRRQVFDPYGNFVYTAFSNKLQAGYKIDKNDKINLTWQRSKYQSDFYGQPPVYGLMSRLQLDGAYRFIIDGQKITNNIVISRQQTNIPLTTGGNYMDNSLLITNTSTIVLNKNPLSLTILSNSSDNNSYYFNTSMFSAEANYSYTIPGWPRMSSGLGYYDNQGWNEQVGIRQQVSAVVQKKITIDFQVSYKKAVEVIQTALANQLFLNTTIHYQFK
jgi:hypothetical protein